MSVTRGGRKRESTTIKQGQRLVIFSDRASRHNKPIERRKNKKGEIIPIKIAEGPTTKRGKRNVVPDARRKAA